MAGITMACLGLPKTENYIMDHDVFACNSQYLEQAFCEPFSHARLYLGVAGSLWD